MTLSFGFEYADCSHLSHRVVWRIHFHPLCVSPRLIPRECSSIYPLHVSKLPNRSPMITHGAMILPVVTRGIIEASAILRPSIP